MKQKEGRVGLYIKPRTRNRLNILRALLSPVEGKPLNQDEIINVAFDSLEQQYNVTIKASAPQEPNHA